MRGLALALVVRVAGFHELGDSLALVFLHHAERDIAVVAVERSVHSIRSIRTDDPVGDHTPGNADPVALRHDVADLLGHHALPHVAGRALAVNLFAFGGQHRFHEVLQHHRFELAIAFRDLLGLGTIVDVAKTVGRAVLVQDCNRIGKAGSVFGKAGCLEGGPIKRGDMIVTSSIIGVAMKADPDKVKPGQVLGKALQEYNKEGIGIIKILVSVK